MPRCISYLHSPPAGSTLYYFFVAKIGYETCYAEHFVTARTESMCCKIYFGAWCNKLDLVLTAVAVLSVVIICIQSGFVCYGSEEVLLCEKDVAAQRQAFVDVYAHVQIGAGNNAHHGDKLQHSQGRAC